MAVSFIGIGSNLGDRTGNCKKAVKALAMKDEISLLKTSSLYYTEPYGDIEQDWFVNSIVKVETGLNPVELLNLLHEIERGFGRIRKADGSPRTLDLDLLFYDNLVMKRDDITLPHPLSHTRAFVLIPLQEIEPNLIHPVLKKTVEELSRDLKDGKRVLPLENQQQSLSYY